MTTEDELLRMIQEAGQRGDSATEAALMAVLKLPPEERDAYIESMTKQYDPMRDDLRADIERNFAQMNKEGPQGQVAGNNQYSVYVAANPLEHLVSGITRYQAGKDMGQQRGELRGLAEEQGGADAFAKRAYADVLSKQTKSTEPTYPGVDSMSEFQRKVQMQAAEMLRKKKEEEELGLEAWWNA